MYIIYKTVGAFNYYLQSQDGYKYWNGLIDNAVKFKISRLAEAYKLLHRIYDGEVKPIKP